MKLYQDTIPSALPQDSMAANRSAMELGPLYEPPPVAFRFETPGWDILAGILLIGLLVVAFFMIRKYIKNRYRREALQTLQKIDGSAATQIFVILKRVAIQVFGREQVGTLYGKEWLQFLEKTGKDVHMMSYEKELIEAIYKDGPMKPESKDGILFNAKKWVKTHASQL